MPDTQFFKKDIGLYNIHLFCGITSIFKEVRTWPDRRTDFQENISENTFKLFG